MVGRSGRTGCDVGPGPRSLSDGGYFGSSSKLDSGFAFDYVAGDQPIGWSSLTTVSGVAGEPGPGRWQAEMVYQLLNDGGHLLAPATVPALTQNLTEPLNQNTFEPAGAITAGALVAQDLNGDGLPDLAFAWGPTAAAMAGPTEFTVLFGLADGGFTFDTSVTVDNGPLWIAAASLTGGGLPDLAVANSQSARFGVAQPWRHGLRHADLVPGRQ